MNKEAIAVRTIELLKDEEKESKPSNQAKQEIDDDWLNLFERYAEVASSDRLRDLWSRVLTGEIRKPQTFYLRTLRFISELDVETAALFEQYAAEVIDGTFITISRETGKRVHDLLY
jgi:Protein of unknown function (DUF2806)